MMNQLAILESLMEVMKNEIATAQAQANDLHCCGNCKNNHVTSIDTYCEISGDEINGHKICSNWTPDGLTRKNRE